MDGGSSDGSVSEAVAHLQAHPEVALVYGDIVDLDTGPAGDVMQRAAVRSQPGALVEIPYARCNIAAMRFAIVTPVMNAARFLDEAILSVVSQAGEFSIRYHVQDGGSTDETIAKLARWAHRLANDFPLFCKDVQFTYSSEPDRGLYEAVNRGFAACGDADVMSWINADDRFEPGAFGLAAHVFARHDVDWLSGAGGLIEETGTSLPPRKMVLFPRDAVAAGLFDGRGSSYHIQQPGTFWRSKLWHACCGIDPTYRVAGDFDLWRRFSSHADLVTVDAVLARFRLRPGQLSGDENECVREVERSIAALDPRWRRTVAKRLQRGKLTAYMVSWHVSEGWRLLARTGRRTLRERLPPSFRARLYRLKRMWFDRSRW